MSLSGPADSTGRLIWLQEALVERRPVLSASPCMFGSGSLLWSVSVEMSMCICKIWLFSSQGASNFRLHTKAALDRQTCNVYSSGFPASVCQREPDWILECFSAPHHLWPLSHELNDFLFCFYLTAEASSEGETVVLAWVTWGDRNETITPGEKSTLWTPRIMHVSIVVVSGWVTIIQRQYCNDFYFRNSSTYSTVRYTLLTWISHAQSVSAGRAHLRVCRCDWMLFNSLDQKTTC